jgi:2-methylcitrate dehydratase PrpD
MTESTDLTKALVAAIATVPARLTDLSQARAQTALIDTIACMIAGRDDPATQAARQAALVEEPYGAATLLGDRQRRPAGIAAFVNGTAAHALDYDDNFFPAITHASAVLFPALLALAETQNQPWGAVIAAYAAGLEAQALLGLIANPGHYGRGWHATSTLGVIGAAVACATLMGATADELAATISITTSFASGSKRQFGSAMKPVHAGLAAQNGIFAAQLARAEIAGAPEMLAGRWGFLDLFHGEASVATLPPPTGPLALDRYGLTQKLYPSCMSSHLGIDALLAALKQADVPLREITAVEIGLPAFMIDNLRFLSPRDALEARFSMNYCAAVTLRDGAPRLAHFTEALVADPELIALAQKVRLTVRPPSAAAQALPWQGDGSARLFLRDGQEVSATIAYPKGSSGNPLTAAELYRKFRDCTAPTLGPTQAEVLFARLHTLAPTDPITALTPFLVSSNPSGAPYAMAHSR